ncbi:hypothetical protein [Burkholderia sp. BCC1999]|uniref:hypothetical protein n=1 Tax=Burkholderia sp. BCC1999 TaxID=2817448 RepID=UPI002AC36592|nr:hypothetical protein [Burkholderia sp. BCC1999]
MRPASTLVATLRGSWIARTLISGISFLVPFIWVLSTDLIWEALKNVSLVTIDAAINIPTGMPLISCVTGAWLLCAFALARAVKSTTRTVLVCNVVATIVFVVASTATVGASIWSIVSGEFNIYPIRFGLAILIAFAASIMTSRVFSGTKDT